MWLWHKKGWYVIYLVVFTFDIKLTHLTLKKKLIKASICIIFTASKIFADFRYVAVANRQVSVRTWIWHLSTRYLRTISARYWNLDIAVISDSRYRSDIAVLYRSDIWIQISQSYRTADIAPISRYYIAPISEFRYRSHIWKQISLRYCGTISRRYRNSDIASYRTADIALISRGTISLRYRNSDIASYRTSDIVPISQDHIGPISEFRLSPSYRASDIGTISLPQFHYSLSVHLPAGWVQFLEISH